MPIGSDSIPVTPTNATAPGVFDLVDEEAQVAFGAALGKALGFHGLVFLEGDLGAGKTTLSRGVMRGLGVNGAIKSPTYTLVESYQQGGIRVNHFDLYRLADPEELEFMGARELFDEGSLQLVEWPSRGEGWLPSPDLIVTISLNPQGRHIELNALTSHGRATLVRLSQASWEAE